MDTPMLIAQKKNAISWIYWIAGLSLVNTLIYLIGQDFGFVIWLWLTQAIDGIGDHSIIATIISFLVAGFFALTGHVTQMGKNGWLLTAIILYTLDAALLLMVDDYVGIGFHIFALTYICKGYMAHRQLTGSVWEEDKTLPEEV